MGWHASDTAELVFEDVLVPAENLVGEENTGFYQIMEAFPPRAPLRRGHRGGEAAASPWT